MRKVPGAVSRMSNRTSDDDVAATWPSTAGIGASPLVKLLKNEGLRGRMGEAGLKRVKARFTVERMVAGTAAVYARVAGRGHEAGTENPEAPVPHLHG